MNIKPDEPTVCHIAQIDTSEKMMYTLLSTVPADRFRPSAMRCSIQLHTNDGVISGFCELTREEEAAVQKVLDAIAERVRLDLGVVQNRRDDYGAGLLSYGR